MMNVNVCTTTFAASAFGSAPNKPTQVRKQPKSACNAQRVANAIPGATLTGNNTFQGGHEEYGVQVSGAGLAGAGFSFYSSPFGNGNGYRTPFGGGHVNGQPGNIAIPTLTAKLLPDKHTSMLEMLHLALVALPNTRS